MIIDGLSGEVYKTAVVPNLMKHICLQLFTT